MSPAKPKTFSGQQVDVTWDARLCIHVGECGRADNELFQANRDPWCQPDLVAIGDTVTVVERCPTGALAYTVADGSVREAPAAENTVHVANNGPLYLRGELRIDAADETMPGVAFRAALCRCGQSKNKPFCDNSHESVSFVDRGAVGTMDPGSVDAPGGPLEVKAAPNGPLLLSGNVSIVAGSGRVAWQGTKCALCRCGASRNKPFCDGTHAKVGFSAP